MYITTNKPHNSQAHKLTYPKSKNSLSHTSWPRQEKLFFNHLSSREYWPRSRKSGDGSFLGDVDEDYRWRQLARSKDLLKTAFFYDVRKKKSPKTAGKNVTVCSRLLSQSTGRGRISREGALDVRESRERRDRIVPKVLPQKQKKRNFGLKFSTFLSRIACCSRESRSVWQNFRQKQP